jgi:hypothetical protein
VIWNGRLYASIMTFYGRDSTTEWFISVLKDLSDGYDELWFYNSLIQPVI